MPHVRDSLLFELLLVLTSTVIALAVRLSGSSIAFFPWLFMAGGGASLLIFSLLRAIPGVRLPAWIGVKHPIPDALLGTAFVLIAVSESSSEPYGSAIGILSLLALLLSIVLSGALGEGSNTSGNRRM
jgi:hypothetical protein